MIDPEQEEEILDFIKEETKRVKYGKLIIEITVLKERCTNIQAETKRSLNLQPA